MNKSKAAAATLMKRIALRKRRAHRPPPGSPPDQLVPAQESLATLIRMFDFDTNGCLDTKPKRDEMLAVTLNDKRKRWIDIQGLGDVELISEIGKNAGLHPLVVADVLHTHQRPKVDVYDDYLVIVLRMPSLTAGSLSEQITLIVSDHFVLSFQEKHGDCFDPVRARLLAGNGRNRIRSSGADYLAYALLDSLIDSYFPLLEKIGERTEDIEEHVLTTRDPGNMSEIHVLKRELLELRHAIWPLRDAIGVLLRDDTPVIRKSTRVYLRDCADHAFQLLDILEVYREVASGLVDLHLSSISNRMNEVMKVLTVIATVFIPMTFIAGVYGMNFDRTSPFNLPELGWRYGYLFSLGLMAATGILITALLYRRGWIGNKNR
ncbi:magnesium/cobalt transporter CorA [Woeseia oceani]|uniref:Magnesium transport protein CorA n=1 Tax=Woeseia oceani TaxID=1548547 RepID=A0A193LLG0_9GAMM|nr:magnesium/cobalt transporter CorA [Woeseia oceani]ANO53327.1 magnesium and cobalt transport protein CorA [Woeseia oceani]